MTSKCFLDEDSSLADVVIGPEGQFASDNCLHFDDRSFVLVKLSDIFFKFMLENDLHNSLLVFSQF